MFNKENSWNYKKIFIIVWIVISVLYIANDLVNRFIFGMYNRGYSTAVNSVIEQALNKECQPFIIYNNDKKVQIINVECLQGSSVQGTGVQKEK